MRGRLTLLRVVWTCIRLVAWIVVFVLRLAAGVLLTFGLLAGSPLAIIVAVSHDNGRRRRR